MSKPVTDRTMLPRPTLPDRRGAALVKYFSDRFGRGPIWGAEVGVHAGQLSAYLLQRMPSLHLHMIDSYRPEEAQRETYRDTPDFCAHLAAPAQAHFLHAAFMSTDFARDRRAIYVMDSLEASRLFIAKSAAWGLHFVFLDGDHSYLGVAADIEAWRKALGFGGVLCGHDYGDPNFPGVREAVDALIKREGCRVDFGDDGTWFTTL